MRSLELSAMYTLPSDATATPNGLLKSPSPEPKVPHLLTNEAFGTGVDVGTGVGVGGGVGVGVRLYSKEISPDIPLGVFKETLYVPGLIGLA